MLHSGQRQGELYLEEKVEPWFWTKNIILIKSWRLLKQSDLQGTSRRRWSSGSIARQPVCTTAFRIDQWWWWILYKSHSKVTKVSTQSWAAQVQSEASILGMAKYGASPSRVNTHPKFTHPTTQLRIEVADYDDWFYGSSWLEASPD